MIRCAVVTLVLAAAWAQADPLDVVTGPEALGDGWTRSGEAEVYTPDTLFELINGEAELYYPYGVKRTIAAKYNREGETDNPIYLELFEMASALDGFGIYSNYRSAKSTIVDIGNAGFASSTEVMFYQGPYFAQLNVATAQESRDRLESCARALSKALPPAQPAPELLTLLDFPSIVPGTPKLALQSLLGYRFFKRGFVAEIYLDGPPEGDPTGEERRARLFVVPETTPEAAAATLEAYLADLAKNQGSVEWQETNAGRVAVVNDPLYQVGVATQAGPCVFGVIGLPAAEDGLRVLEKLDPAKRAKPWPRDRPEYQRPDSLDAQY